MILYQIFIDGRNVIDKKHIFTYIMIMKRYIFIILFLISACAKNEEMKRYIFIILFLISACAKNEEKKFVARRLYMHTFVEIQILGKNQKKIQHAINKAFDAIAETEARRLIKKSKFQIVRLNVCRSRKIFLKKRAGNMTLQFLRLLIYGASAEKIIKENLKKMK